MMPNEVLELEARLVELETRLAFQDNELLKLKTLYASHQKQLYRLETLLNTLLDRVQTVLDSTGDKPANEKPPHY